MKRLILYLICWWILPSFSFSQKNLLDFIKEDSSYTIIKGIDKRNKIIKLPSELKCYEGRHDYIVNQGKLLIHVDGTGKLFELDSSTLEPTRIDNTCYEGYNFYAYNFTWHNQIYNFSGWGFWKFDGGLRYFDQNSKEWSVIAINKQVPFAIGLNAVVWQDVENDKIYVIYNNDKDSYLKKEAIKGDSTFVECFNLKTNNWLDEPKLFRAKNVFNIINAEKKVIQTKDGLLIENGNFLSLLDFNNNRISNLKAEKSSDILNSIVNNQQGFYIIRGNSVNFYNPQKDSISSIILEKKDYSPTNEIVFEDIPVNHNFLFWLISIILILTLITFLTVRKFRSLNNKLQESREIITKKEIEINKSAPFSASLTTQENLLLQFILQKSIKGEFTTIEELNRLLGTKDKDNSVQKNLRAEVLLMINEKFQVYAATTDTLIERERTEFDKRVYHYLINRRYLNKLK